MLTAFLAVALAAPPWQAAGPVPADVQDRALRATVRLQLSNPVDTAQATGIVIGKRPNNNVALILTAWHTVNSDRTIAVELFDPATYPAVAKSVKAVRILSRMPNEDLAVLEADLGPEPPILRVLPPEKVKLNRFPAVSLGCSDGQPPTCRAEKVRQRKLVTKPDGSEALFWECAAVGIVGRSGGPLVNDTGHVVGIASGTQAGLGYYTYIREIHAALAREGLRELSTGP